MGKAAFSGARALIVKHAEALFGRIVDGAKYADIEKEFKIKCSQGYVARVLKELGYDVPTRVKQKCEHTLKAYIESVADEIVKKRKNGHLWKDIQIEYGIRSLDYLRWILSAKGYAYLFARQGSKPSVLPEYLAIEFSPAFLERIGERRRRSFWALMHDAAFVNGFILQSEKNIFYLDLLFKVTGRKAFDEIVSAREFNALFMAAAIVARDATMLERFRSKFVDHLKPRKYEEEPQDTRRKDCKGVLK